MCAVFPYLLDPIRDTMWPRRIVIVQFCVPLSDTTYRFRCDNKTDSPGCIGTL